MIQGTDEWNQFSCLHSTGEEPFNFVLYNSSHRLKDNQVINNKSRYVIKFPSKGSYFIVFHGRLVHNGDKAILNRSGKPLLSARMFSYLRVPDHNARFNGNVRHSGRLKNYSSNVHYGTVDRDSFTFRNDFSEISSSNIIELPANYHLLKKNMSQIQPIVGNMNLDGWEVYEGINFKISDLKNHSYELKNFITQTSKKWSGISSTNRKMIILSSLEVMTSTIREKYPSIYRAFKHLLNERLRKIPYLEEVEMDNQVILANIGDVQEQQPHRDFSSIRK